MKIDKITDQQDYFCRQYIIDLDRDRAFLAAYPNTHPHQLKHKAKVLFDKIKIQKHIQQLKLERADRVALTADVVLQKIMVVVDRCMQAEPVIANGVVTGEYQFKEMGALRGLELLAKHFGLLTERVEITNPVLEMLQRKLDGVSSDDLRQFIRNVKRTPVEPKQLANR